MTNIDMLPESFVQEKQKSRVDLLCIILFAVVMVVLVVAEYWTGKEFDEVKEAHESAKARFAQAENTVTTFNDNNVLRGRHAGRLRKAIDITSRFPCSRIMAGVAEAAEGKEVCILSWQLKRLLRDPREKVEPGEGKGLEAKRKVVSSKGKPGDKPPPQKLGRFFEVRLDAVAENGDEIEKFVVSLRVARLTSPAGDVPMFDEVRMPWAAVDDFRIQKTDCKKFPVQLLVDSTRWEKPAQPKPPAPEPEGKAGEGGTE
jgi:hypothetical protein